MSLRSLAPLAALTALACAGPPASPSEGRAEARPLASALADAFAEEAHGRDDAATSRYLAVLERAAASRPDVWQVLYARAALDALVSRSVAALSPSTSHSALVYRTADPTLVRGDNLAAEEHESGSIAYGLSQAYAQAAGPFVKGVIAERMVELAMFRGDASGAARWREASGCAREATVVGPLDWAPLSGVVGPDVLAAFDTPLAKGYPGPGAFAPVLAPVVERGHGCSIDLAAESSNAGVRDVVVDVVVKKAGRIGLALRSSARATLRVGGQLVLDRPYDLGGGDVTRFGWAEVGIGTVRMVARVGVDQEGESLRISAWDVDGAPLEMRAPRPGEAANVRALGGEQAFYPEAAAPAEELAVALAALAMGDSHAAEYLLEKDGAAATAPPDLSLVYGRAVLDARDVSIVRRVERARSAYERTLAVWPDAWEAIADHAWVTGETHGPADARFAELGDLAASRLRAGSPKSFVLDAFEVATAARAHLFDHSHVAAARIGDRDRRTALMVEIDSAAEGRSAADQVTYDCAAHPGSAHARDSFACYHALRGIGDLRGALAELERLRAVYGGVDLFLPATLSDALAIGDQRAAESALSDELPAEITLSALFGVLSLTPAEHARGPDVHDRLLGAIVRAHDAPIAVGPLFHALGDDPTLRFAGLAESARQGEGANTPLAGAATLVLRHTERYDIASTGVVHAVVYDLRRVNGTTDVDENAQASPPQITGRTALRVLKRRILKQSGVVVEPDPNPGASQGHADLAQLETGDSVEAIYEAWSVPLETGEIGIDTVDLLPERTAVHEAEVEIHAPSGLSLSLWSHPVLGAPTRTANGGETVLRWTLKDHVARRVEDATPKMDRSVAVSLSTSRWSEVARGLRESELARVDRDPAVLAWAASVVKDAKAESDHDKVDALVTAVGATVREGDPGELSDILYGHATGPQTSTARGILSDHEGSRTWLIVRALRAIGVPCEVVVAENEPWSAAADYPPHLGRFVHPIALAHVKGGGTVADVLIDADVSGPPLPAGHISPELRGRFALHEDGRIAPLPTESTDGERDEVDERLAVDEHGDARGTFTILLRGHDAQEIAEALEKTVGDQRERALRSIVMAWVPYANVDSIELSSSEGSWQVALRAEVTIGGYAQRDGSSAGRTETWSLPGLEPIHYVYPRSSSSTLSATYASEGARESALAVSHAVLYHAHRRVELPPQTTVTRAAAPFSVATGPLTAAREIHVTVGAAPVIEDSWTLGVPTGTVPATGYAAFVDGAHRADDAFLASTRVTRDVSLRRPAH
jgi:hypothetical protein